MLGEYVAGLEPNGPNFASLCLAPRSPNDDVHAIVQKYDGGVLEIRPLAFDEPDGYEIPGSQRRHAVASMARADRRPGKRQARQGL